MSGYALREAGYRRVLARIADVLKLQGKPVWAFLGLSFPFAWVQLMSTGRVLFLPPGNLPPLPIVPLFSTAAMLTSSLTLVALATRVTPIQAKREALHLFGAIGAIATAGVPLTSSGVLDAYWLVVCSVVALAISTWLTISWYEHFIALEVRGAFLCYVASIIGGALLSLIISLLPQSIGVLCTVMLPILSTLTLRPLRNPRL